MTSAAPGNQASVTVFVEAPIDIAFTVFTEETDLWWRRGMKYRIAGKRPGTWSTSTGFPVRGSKCRTPDR